MATPLTATQIVAALRAEGLVVHEVREWRTHNRNHVGAWGPVNGVMIHHTVTSSVSGTVDLCYDGRSDLPGPLCLGVIDKAGEVWLVGNGRANHAGSGDDDVLTAVVNESYGDYPPAPNENNTDGNSRFYGFECINWGDGEDPWPAVQLEGIEKASAALCRAHGWGKRSVIGHKEWTNQKVDPRGIDMKTMRDRVGARLAGQEDDVALTTEDKTWVAAEIREAIRELVAVEVITKDGIIDNPNPDTAGDNAHISVETALRNIEIVSRRTEGKVGTLQAVALTDEQVAAIADKLAVNPALTEALAETLADKLAARLSS
ncbi:peptidoglycan recognition protein family protein [Streptomyces sp. 4N124]|uniref:peptidoglycan recognition protein family protein n=1 Tax=Streptomyces sp. 4N124 TaxID=3457420 RepID=UPI003FD540C4